MSFAMMPEITINVLGYFDESEDAWCALALEMDLRGYGDTFDEAMDDLNDQVAMQIAFAQFKGTPEMAFKLADSVWLEAYSEAKRDALVSYPSEPHSAYKASSTSMPPAHVIHEIQEGLLAAG